MLLEEEIVRASEYLRAIRAKQDKCERATEERAPEINRTLPAAIDQTAQTLMLLEQYGSCHWGCHGGDHLIERFAARATSYCLASIRLLWMGHYDEAYSLLRTVGELANLLFLFASDRSQMTRWRDADEGQRRNDFGAAGVRAILASLQLPAILNRRRFAMLSGRFAHAGQLPVAQLHNPDGLMTMGGRLQPGGLDYGMAQLTVFVGTIGWSLSELGDMSDDHRAELQSAAEHLMTIME